MLKNDLYFIEETERGENNFSCSLKLNPEHSIFSGHFPAQPVLPGACMLQIVQEILSEQAGRTLRLKKASNLKFIAPVDPNQTEELQLTMTYKNLEKDFSVTASLQVNGVVCFKLQAVFG